MGRAHPLVAYLVSTRLALGAAGVLAGLAALGSRGSRSAAASVSLDILEDEHILQVMRDDDEDGVVGAVFVNRDGDVEHIGDLRLYSVFSGEVEAYAAFGDDYDEGIAMEWISMLREAAHYFTGQAFPMEVYRGLRVDDVRKVKTDDPGYSWTPEIRIAKMFAEGAHLAARRHGGSVVLRATLMEPENVDWETTVGLYIAFSAPSPSEAEMQIRPLRPERDLRDIRVLQ